MAVVCLQRKETWYGRVKWQDDNTVGMFGIVFFDFHGQVNDLVSNQRHTAVWMNPEWRNDWIDFTIKTITKNFVLSFIEI